MAKQEKQAEMNTADAALAAEEAEFNAGLLAEEQARNLIEIAPAVVATGDTHRVVGKRHNRADNKVANVVFEPGDLITPTPGELSAFPKRFELLN